MIGIRSFLRKSFDKKIDGTGLAIFRICYSIILLCEIAHIYYFRHLIFDKIPYIDKPEITFFIPIFIWFVSVVFLLFGAFTRLSAIINYLMSLILIGSIQAFEYHVFYAYMGINFIFLFMPVSNCLSLDRLFLKLKYSNTTFQYNPPKLVSQLYYFIIPFIGLGLVYFDSVFFKIASKMWLNGLGSWLPSSLPMITQVNANWFLNQEYLVKFIGIATIIFESIFLIVFYRKKWRMPVIIIGLILHIGILFEFPIPLFALTACCIYILMIPVSFWKNLFSVTKQNSSLLFYYDSECPLCVRTKIIISHLDWYNKIEFKTVQFDASSSDALKPFTTEQLLDNIYSVSKSGKVFSGIDTYIQVFSRIFYLVPVALFLRIPGIYHLAKKAYNYIAINRTLERCTEENCGYNPPQIPNDATFKILNNFTLLDLKYKMLVFFLAVVTVFQFMLLNNTWSIVNTKLYFGLDKYALNHVFKTKMEPISKFFKTTLGVTNHPVFTNEIHFDKYNHVIAVVYVDKNGNEQWLPIVDKNGQPDFYIYGANWVNWTFRVNGNEIKQDQLALGIQNYTAFWAFNNGVDLNDAKFIIKVKKIAIPKGWEKDFLNRQIAKPWIDGGFVEWKSKKFVSNLKLIESL